MTTRIKNDKWQYTPWSAWGPLEPAPTKPGYIPHARRCRSRIWVHTWTTEEIKIETYKYWQCPTNYEPTGDGWCSYRGMESGEHGIIRATGGQTYTKTTVLSSEGHVDSGTENDCQILAQYTDVRHASITPRGMRPYTRVEVPVGRARLGIAGSGFEMSLDGRDLGRAHTIKSDELGVGTSILEIRGRTPGAEETIQVVLDVVPPVELTVREPISFLEGGETAVKFPVRLRNESPSDQSVVVEVVARPPGWLGGIAENPCQRLDPGKGCTVHVALERVVPPSRRERGKQLIPVTLRAIPNGDVRSAVFVTAYLGAEGGATNGRRRRAARRPRAKATGG